MKVRAPYCAQPYVNCRRIAKQDVYSIAKAAPKMFSSLSGTAARLGSKLPTTTAPQAANATARIFSARRKHQIEYAAPLRFGGRTKGALVVAFDRREDLGETESRLIEAAAQQAALAAHISSSLPGRARNIEDPGEGGRSPHRGSRGPTTLSLKRSSTVLPLSLYAVDSQYRIVAWNRNRELGELGIPRGVAFWAKIFSRS